jgi:hypothetical protein
MLNVRLRPKLFKELRPGTRVVSNAFDMGDWKPDSTMNVKNEGGFTSYAYYWRIPADVAGTWKLTAPGAPGGGYTLKLEQRYQQVTGTAESSGRSTPLGAVRLAGDTIAFSLQQGSRPVRFTGTVQADRMTGTAGGGQGSPGSWSASRTAEGARPELVAGDSVPQ